MMLQVIYAREPKQPLAIPMPQGLSGLGGVLSTRRTQKARPLGGRDMARLDQSDPQDDLTAVLPTR